MTKSKRPAHYKIPMPKNERFTGNLNRPVEDKKGEQLTGFVDGQKASDLEERFAYSLRKNRRVEGFDFQPSFIAGRNMPGEIRLDFMVYSGMVQYPIQIDGEFAHKTATQKELDKQKDAILNDALYGTSAVKVERINGSMIKTQEESDRLVIGKW